MTRSPLRFVSSCIPTSSSVHNPNTRLQTTKRMKIKHFKLFLTLTAGLAAGAVQAADTFFDFDSNPLPPGVKSCFPVLPNGGTPCTSGFIIVGSHADAGLVWCSGAVDANSMPVATNGNPATGGYLSIADGGVGGQNTVIVFPDIDAGAPVKAFHLTADVRAGNPAGNNCNGPPQTDGNCGRPADGFSISYCREGDPILVNATNGFGYGAAGGDSCAEAQSSTTSATLENGTRTGVAIIFDAWQGNTLPDTGPGGTCGPDVEGIAVRVDDHTLKQINMQPDRNGACGYDPNADRPYAPTNAACAAGICADPGTEQTGPWLDDDGSFTNLCWVQLDVVLDTNKQVTVMWKGSVLLDHFQLANYASHRGRLVLMGRTGGANQNAHFDNIHLVTTPAINESTFGRLFFGPGLNQFYFTIDDNGASVVTSISQVLLDGSNVTALVTTTRNGSVTTGTYNQTPFFPSSTTHTVDVSWQDSQGKTWSVVGQKFTVIPYLTLPPSLAVSSVDLTQPGFFIAPWATDAGNPNRNYWSDEQVEGLHGPNLVNFSLTVSNATNNAEAWWDGAIDFQNGATGQFPYDYVWDGLGFPAAGHTNDNNSSAVFTSYLYFPTNGLYYLGVNSDDGFRLSFDRNSHSVLGTFIPGSLSFDGGRGIGLNQNVTIVRIIQPGYYGARLLFENGGGGCNVELYTTSTPLSGVVDILVNDTNYLDAVLGYRSSPVAPAYVSFAEPPLDDTEALLNIDLHYKITDSSTTVTPGNVGLAVNGVVRAPTVTKSGNVTDVLQLHPPVFWPTGTNTVTLSFTDSVSAVYSYTYTFNVQSYGTNTLSTNTWTAVGSGFSPGYRLKVFQSPNTNLFNGWDVSLVVANAAMNGLYGSNIANLSGVNARGEYINSGVINYSQDDGGNQTTNGDFQGGFTPSRPDLSVLGLPGVIGTNGSGAMNNDAYAAVSFVEFPTAGAYLMGVNSDDGFRVTQGDRTSPGRSIFGVLAPKSIRGDYIGINTRNGLNGQGFGGPLPTVPLIGQCVVTDPLDASTTLNNASAIAGKIALTQRGAVNFAAQSHNCFAAGAIAVIGTLGSGDVGKLPSQRGGTATEVTVPCVEISYEDGTNLIAHATTNSSSPLYVRVSDDASRNLGEFNGGRGASDSLFVVNVPQPGVYPLRLLWYNGGGDANSEFFWIDSSGTKILVNDPTSSVKAWTQRIFPTTGAHLTIVPGPGAGNVTISWTGEGELEYAYDITGPWNAAANQNNPQTVAATVVPGLNTYYRLLSY